MTLLKSNAVLYPLPWLKKIILEIMLAIVTVNVCPAPARLGAKVCPVPPGHEIVGGADARYPVPAFVIVMAETAEDIVGVKVCPEPAYVGVNTPPVPSAHPIVGGL